MASKWRANIWNFGCNGDGLLMLALKQGSTTVAIGNREGYHPYFYTEYINLGGDLGWQLVGQLRGGKPHFPYGVAVEPDTH